MNTIIKVIDNKLTGAATTFVVLVLLKLLFAFLNAREVR